MSIEKQKSEPWNLAAELVFINELGRRSVNLMITPRELLKKYEASLEKRRRWWPGFVASDFHVIKAAISQRMAEVQ